MSETHISYKTAKALKEFLGESAPKPIKDYLGAIHLYDPECESDGILQGVSVGDDDYPAYQLHDLLSKPFCEAMAKKMGTEHWVKVHNAPLIMDGRGCFEYLSVAYYSGNMPAVEAELMRMMEAKLKS